MRNKTIPKLIGCIESNEVLKENVLLLILILKRRAILDQKLSPNFLEEDKEKQSRNWK